MRLLQLPFILMCTLIFVNCASSSKESPAKMDSALTEVEKIKAQIEAKKRISKRLSELANAAKASGEEKVKFLAGDMYLKASAALLEGDYQSANLVFEQLVELVPEDDYIKQKYAISLIKTGEFEQAETLLYSVFERSKQKDLKVGLVLAGVYASLGETKKSRDVYVSLLKTHPESEESCIFLGKSYALEDQTKKAVSLLKGCERKNPKRGIYSYYIGKIYVDKKMYKTAMNYFKKSLKQEPEFAQASVGLGLIYEELGKKKLAKKTYLDYIKKQPNDTLVLSRLVQLMFTEKQFTEVIQYAEMLSDYEPDNLNLKAKLAILYKDMGEYSKAISGFKHLLTHAPDNEDLLYYLGSIYQETKKYEDAIEAFAKITPNSGLYQDSSLQIAQMLAHLAKEEHKSKPGSKVTHIEFTSFTKRKVEELKDFRVDFSLILATYYEAIGENLAAIKSLRSVDEDKEFGTDHKFYLASLYEKEKKYSDSELVIKSIIDAEPENAHAWNFLGYSLLEREIKLDQAKEYITKAVELSPKDGYIRDSLGWYFFKVGKTKEALKELNVAVKTVPDDVAINKHLAIVHTKLNDFTKARSYIEKAIGVAQDAKERAELTEVLKELRKNRIPASFQVFK